MSYLLYINGFLIELSGDTKIAQTKQVNDLAQLDNRQSNFTHKFTVPPTANNIKAMKSAYLVGSISNVPYQKNECSLFDADSNVCLIYKGWANISQSSKKGYEINIYDGLIDFYRRIENKNLTAVGLSELNHAKSLAKIKESWENDLPFIYAVADYNGNNTFTPASGISVQINTDYQIPSARVSFIWNKIFEYAGFTYSGLYFETQDFLNLFLTFPKPVPILGPITSLIKNYNGYVAEQTVEIPTGFGFEYGTVYYGVVMPDGITGNPHVSQSVALAPILVETTGSYLLRASGTFCNNFSCNPVIVYSVKDASNNVILTGEYNTETEPYKVIPAAATNKISFGVTMTGAVNSNVNNTMTGSFTCSFEYVIGFDANFEQALLDFTITDFVKEIITEAGLTAFKDKYSNHIEFLQLNEILNSSDRIDWSKKFQYKDVEKYKIGKYAKKNNFKYRYNSENENHNDGFIEIADENLADQVDIVQSRLYTPEKRGGIIYGKYVPIFKIWEKELKDDLTIEYKDLAGRFYFLRVKHSTLVIRIASESLKTELTTSVIAFANYSNLDFKEIINRNYTSIGRILNQAKIIDGYFNLTTLDFEAFNFKKLIYVEQLASNYLVNKIPNFIKGRIAKCELIEVDYNPTLDIVVVPDATYVTIDSYSAKGCQLEIQYSTDAPIGSTLLFVCNVNDFGIPNLGAISDALSQQFYIVTTAESGNTATLTTLNGAYYISYLQLVNENINSNTIFFENTGSCFIETPVVSISRLTIDNVVQGALNAWLQPWQIYFATDASLPLNILVRTFNTPVSDLNSPFFGLGGWTEYSQAGTTNNFNIEHLTTVVVFGGPISKFQIKIGNFESNIYDL